MEQEIRKYISDIALEKGIELDDNTNLYECGIMDSMETVLFLTYINEKLHVQINFTDLNFENFISINAIIKWLTKNRI